MRFADITGHSRQIAELREMVDSGRIPHALLLGGPAGVGKMMTARAFSQYLNCENRSGGDSCGVCPSCLQHASSQFPDLHYAYPIRKVAHEHETSASYLEEWRKMLDSEPLMTPQVWNDIIDAGNTQPIYYVTQADEIRSDASLSPYSARYKVFILWLPERMNTETANKLLKLLEEPYPDTVFILVSNDEAQILPTIYSRTRRVAFKRLSDEEIADYLVRTRGLTPERAAVEARLAEGSLAAAERAVSLDGETMEFREMFRDIMRAAYGRNALKMKDISEKMAAMGREKTRRMLDYCSVQVRENFIYNMRLPELVRLTADEMAFSSRFAPFIHAGNVERLSEEMRRAADEIARNANAKIVCFDLLLLVMQLIRMPRPEGV